MKISIQFHLRSPSLSSLKGHLSCPNSQSHAVFNRRTQPGCQIRLLPHSPHPLILPSLSAAALSRTVFTSRSWAIRLRRDLLFTPLLPSVQSSGSQSILRCEINPSTDSPLHLPLLPFLPVSINHSTLYSFIYTSL